MNFLFIALIKAYRRFLSPILPKACRYYPSCSQYALEAFQKHGFFCAFYLSSKRILKCNPFFAGGIDSVPETCWHHHTNANNLTMDGIHGRKEF
jgi:uncharacterized protein